MFESIFESSTITSAITISDSVICLISSIVLGLVIAFTYMKTSRYTKNFLITLVMLPVLVQVVIMMVNGNLGTSVAVLGAFSLVRFRSVPGNSKEIVSIFWAMAVGLAIGMGQITFAIMFTIFLAIILLTLSKTTFGEQKGMRKNLKITIPENLNYTEVFDDIFKKYNIKEELVKIKTTNMGSMYDLTYSISINNDFEKDFIDELRCRNGNLPIIINRNQMDENEL